MLPCLVMVDDLTDIYLHEKLQEDAMSSVNHVSTAGVVQHVLILFDFQCFRSGSP